MIDVPDSTNYDTLWAAQQLATVYGGVLRWTPQRKWLVWNGAHWRVDETNDVRKYAAALVLQWQADADTQANRDLWKLCNPRSKNIHTLLNTMINGAADVAALQVADTLFDQHPLLLPCANACTVDLRNGAALTPDPAHLLTKSTPVAYLPVAPCPRWEAFLETTFNGDQEIIGFVQRVFGYCLTGLTTEKVFFILHGPKNTGKSTLLSVLRALLGQDYATEAQYGTFFIQKYQKIRDDVAELQEYRVVTASETERGEELAIGLIKQLVGGVDIIRARKLYQNAQQFRPQMKIVVATNHLPRIDDPDVWDRIRVIPCQVQWAMPDLAAEGELTANTNLEKELLSEIEGILAWAVRGCLAYLAHGLQSPFAVLNAGREYQQQEDYTAAFLEEMTTTGESSTRCADLYALYLAWWEHSGYDKHRALSKILFSKDVARRGYVKTHKVDGDHWLGMEPRQLAQTVESRARN